MHQKTLFSILGGILIGLFGLYFVSFDGWFWKPKVESNGYVFSATSPQYFTSFSGSIPDKVLSGIQWGEKDYLQLGCDIGDDQMYALISWYRYVKLFDKSKFMLEEFKRCYSVRPFGRNELARDFLYSLAALYESWGQYYELDKKDFDQSEKKYAIAADTYFVLLNNFKDSPLLSSNERLQYTDRMNACKQKSGK